MCISVMPVTLDQLIGSDLQTSAPAQASPILASPTANHVSRLLIAF